jgi:hypothetical protein
MAFLVSSVFRLLSLCLAILTFLSLPPYLLHACYMSTSSDVILHFIHLSELHNLIPEAIPSQKCHVNSRRSDCHLLRM